MLSNLVKSIDLFGKNFNFRIKESKLVTSSIGGVLSLLLCAITIVIAFLFGKNFLFRLNPSILSQKIIGKEVIYTPINNYNFTIAFNMETDYSEINIPEFLEIIIFYTKIKVDYSTNKKIYQIIDIPMNYTKCNKLTNLNPSLISSTVIENLNCINLPNDTNIGGNWEIF